MSLDKDTIAAIATAPGAAGIGIIRLSGPASKTMARQITGIELQPRYAHYAHFSKAGATTAQRIDSGIALYFPAPASFTGEDVVELQGHGSMVALDMLLRELVALGARPARPGEFSERAFLNDKIDLVQAEAIADLINSRTKQAARGALKSLQGEFSRKLNALAQQIIQLRVYIEAALDFPEEEIDFLNDRQIHQQLEDLQQALRTTVQQTRQGTLLQEGLQIAIAGQPNAGKSSLMNALSGEDTAIVTATAGTTRDLVREQIQIDGLHIQLLDTAGLRESTDAIEAEGIRRAQREFERADLVLLVNDSSASPKWSQQTPAELWPGKPPAAEILAKTLLVHNKGDLLPTACDKPREGILVSAKTGLGIDTLRQQIKRRANYSDTDAEHGHGDANPFIARRRHLSAIERAAELVDHGYRQLREAGAGELLAEDLRQAHACLGEITGTVSADDLLGEIFSSFCIGK